MEIDDISASNVLIPSLIHLFVIFIQLFQRFVKIFMKRNHSLCRSNFLSRDYSDGFIVEVNQIPGEGEQLFFTWPKACVIQDQHGPLEVGWGTFAFCS